jgi:hypothetical protein
LDSRKMKKYILYEALLEHESGLYLKESNGTLASDIGWTIDVDIATEAQIARYRKNLRKMVENAESKLD